MLHRMPVAPSLTTSGKAAVERSDHWLATGHGLQNCVAETLKPRRKPYHPAAGTVELAFRRRFNPVAQGLVA